MEDNLIFFVMKHLKKVYNFITFRYLTMLKIKNELPDDSIYKNIVQDELDFYYFYVLTGYYERNPGEREKYLNFYNKNKAKINMLFKEFVSMKKYMEIDNSNDTVQIDLKKSKQHIFGYCLFILVLITIPFWGYSFFLFNLLFLLFLLEGIGLIILLFISMSLIEPFERAKKYKKISKI